MKRLLRLGALMSALAAQACMSSTLVLHVMPDGSGQAVIASRVFEVRHPRLRRALSGTPGRSAEARGVAAGDQRRGASGAARREGSPRLHQARQGERRRHSDDRGRVRRRDGAPVAVSAGLHERGPGVRDGRDRGSAAHHVRDQAARERRSSAARQVARRAAAGEVAVRAAGDHVSDRLARGAVVQEGDQGSGGALLRRARAAAAAHQRARPRGPIAPPSSISISTR